jgi:hypothetical protein
MARKFKGRHVRIRLCALLVIVVPAALLGSQPDATKPGAGRRYTTLERLSPERLQAVHDDRLRYQRTRTKVTLLTGYDDVRAVLHAHADDSSHTGGTRAELLAAAKRTGVRIVMLADHVRPPRDFIDDSWRGMRDGVLFIPGAESEGFLVHPQRSIVTAGTEKRWKTRDEYVRLVRAGGGNIFLSHVEEKEDWPTGELDGLEIYNHHADFADEREFAAWLRGSFTDPDRLRHIEQLLARFPTELFGAMQDYPERAIAKWDRDLLSHRLTGVAANDCHHNQVFTIRAAGQDTIEIGVIGEPPRAVPAAQVARGAAMLQGRADGEVIARLDFDPYERSLSYVTTHLLVSEVSEASVRQALKQSRAYVAHDWLADPTGFAFIAERDGRRAGVIGDDVRLVRGLRLRAAAAAAGRFRLFHNGRPIREADSDRIAFDVTEEGVYRVEVWLEVDGEQRPWIYSNPIRIEKASVGLD